MNINTSNNSNAIQQKRLEEQQQQNKVQQEQQVQQKQQDSKVEQEKVDLKYADYTKQQVEQNKVSDQKTQQDKTDRINQIKQQIQNGQFKVNSNAIADKMLKNRNTVSLLLSDQ